MKDLSLCMKENGEKTKSLFNQCREISFSILLQLNCFVIVSLQHPRSADLLRWPKHFHPTEYVIKEFPFSSYSTLMSFSLC